MTNLNRDQSDQSDQINSEAAQWYCLTGIGRPCYVLGYYREAIELWLAANAYNRLCGEATYCTIGLAADADAIEREVVANFGAAPTIAETITTIAVLS